MYSYRLSAEEIYSSIFPLGDGMYRYYTKPFTEYVTFEGHEQFRFGLITGELKEIVLEQVNGNLYKLFRTYYYVDLPQKLIKHYR